MLLDLFLQLTTLIVIRHLKVIRDEQLFAIVGGLVIIDVILLSLWTGIDPMIQEMEIFYNEVGQDNVFQATQSLFTLRNN